MLQTHKAADRGDVAARARGLTLRRAWVLLVLAVVPSYFLLPSDPLRDALWSMLLLGATLACLAGTRLYEPRMPGVWYLVALGLTTVSLANAFWLLEKVRTGNPDPDVAAGMVLQLAGMCMIFVSFVLTARARPASDSHAQALDTAAISIGLWLVAWLYGIDPLVVAIGADAAVRAQVAIFTFVSMALAITMVRSLVLEGQRNITTQAWSLAAILTIVSTLNYSIKHPAGTYRSGDPLDIAQLLAMLVVGYIALSPWMVRYTSIPTASNPQRWRADRVRIPVLGVAVMAFPAVAAVRLPVVDDTSVRIGAGAGLLLTAAVFARLVLLSRHLSGIARSLERGRVEQEHLLERTVGTVEQERTLVSMELHDGPVQSLATAAMRLEAARMLLDAGDTERADELVDRATAGVLDEVTVLRRMIHELRPPEIETRGLVGAIGELATQAMRDSGGTMEVIVDARPPDDLPPMIEIVVYRILQEAIANAVRHSAATEVRVEVTRTEHGDGAHGVGVSIADDGHGFDTGAIEQTRQAGLAIMRERVEFAGGTWRVHSRSGRGTRITAGIPLAATLGERAEAGRTLLEAT